MQDYRSVVHAVGAPDAIEIEPIADSPVPPGQVRVRNRVIGVNYMDIYHRSGRGPLPLPTGLGGEGAGVVEAVGPDVTGVEVGDRVAYLLAKMGSYATRIDLPTDYLIRLPDAISDEQAAGVLLKGLTAYAVVTCAELKPGQSALVHAAAGGVGGLLVQWLSSTGVRVIAHSGSAEKAAVATRLGAAVSLHGPFETLAAEVRAANGGDGVEVVFDGVGADSWTASLDSLRRRGLMINFGNSSGPSPLLDTRELYARGSLFLTRLAVSDYIAPRAQFEAAAAGLFAMIETGKLKVEIGLRAALKDAAEAHRALEARKTTGSVILIP